MSHYIRKELKYKMSHETFRSVKEKFAPYLAEDSYHFQTIHSVYYDTEHDSIISRSVEGAAFKEKLRLRAYETGGVLYPYVFMELKRKYKGISYKRRVQITLDEARGLLSGGEPSAVLGNGLIAKEILFFLRTTSSKPRIHLSYERYSYVGKTEEDLRVTFDTNVLSRTENIDFTLTSSDKALLDEGECLMEIKSSYAFPLWMTNVLTECKIFPVSFSKYGRIFEKRFKETMNERSG